MAWTSVPLPTLIALGFGVVMFMASAKSAVKFVTADVDHAAQDQFAVIHHANRECLKPMSTSATDSLANSLRATTIQKHSPAMIPGTMWSGNQPGVFNRRLKIVNQLLLHAATSTFNFGIEPVLAASAVLPCDFGGKNVAIKNIDSACSCCK